jgi:predicted 2-oxoglutarate/Fe(II)-dependent dioxygenase YbiX
MAPVTKPLARGQRAPDFVLPRHNGKPTRFYAIAGGAPSVLLFCDRQVSLYTDAGLDTPVEVLFDTEGAVRAAYGVGRGSTAFALDANLRVLGVVDDPLNDPARLQVLLADAGGDLEPVEVTAQAPVLFVPYALDQQACAWLIQLWHTHGNVDTGVESSVEGRRAETLSETHKRRRDHTVTNPHASGRIATMVGKAIMPEVHKAFAYRATRFEGFKIGCYDASTGGFFRAHRDNLSPSTAHRRFALTLNLNDGYEGGQLRFPEYGPQRYRPPAGGALVFSCSLLHEVLDVTRGQRFVLLSFLYGEEGKSPSVQERGAT